MLSMLRNGSSEKYGGKGFLEAFSKEIWKHTVNILFKNHNLSKIPSQPAIACSKLTIETLEQGVKYVQS